MAEPKYLLAKYIPDPYRMEPRNIGVILWASGGLASRFLSADAAAFVGDAENYQRWVDYWTAACNKQTLPLGRDRKEVSRRSPEILEAIAETQRGAFALHAAGAVFQQVRASGRDSAADYLFRKLVAIGDDTADGTEPTTRETLSRQCNAVFRDAGLLDRDEFHNGLQIELEAAGVRQPFRFDHAWKNGHLGALLQEVNLRRQPSTTNAAFLFEHAKKTAAARDAERYALIDSRAAADDDAAQARLSMLGKLCRVVDVANHEAAVEQVSSVLAL